MLKKVIQFFEENFSSDSLTEEDKDHQINLAVAALLTEVAAIDDGISAEEKASISHLLHKRLNLPQAEIDALQQLSFEELQEATDYYQFTSLIKENFNAEQRIEIIEQLWLIALADGRIDHHEEHFIRKIAELLFVPHSAYIQAKLKIINSAQ